MCDNIMRHAATVMSHREWMANSVPTTCACAPTMNEFASIAVITVSDCIRNHFVRMWQSMARMELNGTLYPALIDSTLQLPWLNYIPCSNYVFRNPNRFVGRLYLLAATEAAAVHLPVHSVWVTTPTKTINITINVLLRQHQFAHVVSSTGLDLLWISPTNRFASILMANDIWFYRFCKWNSIVCAVRCAPCSLCCVEI